MLLARQKKKQSTLKGGEGRGSGKGLNSRYGGYWKLEKVFFFYGSVSKILQLVVALVSWPKSFPRDAYEMIVNGYEAPWLRPVFIFK